MLPGRFWPKRPRANITLIGDVPIFIAHDSADVWAHRELFQLDAAGMPLYVAGVPPDYFSEDGQKWGRCSTIGTPTSVRVGDGGSRMKRMYRLFDVVRIDHFRGFHSNWAVPADDDDARRGLARRAQGRIASCSGPACALSRAHSRRRFGHHSRRGHQLRRRHGLPEWP